MLVAGLLSASGTALASPGQRSLRGTTPAPTTGDGFPSPAPTAAAQAAALAQMTGLSPQQVSTRSACPVPAPGHAGCAAHVAVLRSSGALVHPRLHPDQALADVSQARRPGRSRPAASPQAGTPQLGATVSASASGQVAPAPGTPAWLQQAYDLSYLSATRGTGDTVAIIDAYDDPTAASDLATFRAEYGLPACTASNGCFQKVNEYGSSTSSSLPARNSAWETEEALDLDAVSSLCPNCHIILVEAASSSRRDLAQAMSTAAGLGANQLSNSWSIVSSTPIRGTYTWPNVTTVASTGDNGYLGTSGDAYPAAFPGVTAAGGTTLAAATSGARGFAESAWSGTGSGCDLSEAKPSYQVDTGCTGRSYADVSADADPNTGLSVYDSGSGGWILVGGTSLATPLIAAYDAITGVAGATPQWAYADSSLLNDPVSGSNGTCAASISYICDAAPGFDGPTGAGSISGQVTAGGPGVGGPTMSGGSSYVASVDATSASMVGGIYPNETDTTYWWEYGLTTAYGEQTSAVDIGSGSAAVAVADTLPDLSPSTTYHYRLVASNSVGTTYGYDYTLTTPSTSAPPVAPQSTSGTTTSGGDTTPQGQVVNTPASNTTTTTTTTTPVTTSPTPPVTTSTTPVATAPVTPVVSPPTTPASPPSETTIASPPVTYSPAPLSSPVIITAPHLTGPAQVGATLWLTGGRYGNGTVTAVEFERCAHTCVEISRGRSASVTVTPADAGQYVRARITVSGPSGSVSIWATGAVGPVRSTTAGAAALRVGAGVIRGSAGRPLAQVSSSRGVVRTHEAAVGSAMTSTVRFIRAAGARGGLSVWACVVDSASSAACTAPVAVRHTVSLRVALRAGEAVELVAVARG